MEKKASGQDWHPWEGSVRNRRSTHVDPHLGEGTDRLTIWASQSGDPAQRRQAPFLAGKSAETNGRPGEA